jgi:hypothetical protein
LKIRKRSTSEHRVVSNVLLLEEEYLSRFGHLSTKKRKREDNLKEKYFIKKVEKASIFEK